MSFYSDLAKTAKKMLAQFGQVVTRREYVAGNYDPLTGTSLQATTDTSRQGVLFDFGAGVTSMRGELIQLTDKRLLVDSDGPVSADDHFIVGGVEYTVVTMGEINPGGTSVLYDLHLRNG